MADYYLEFSETLDGLEPKEEKWLREQLAADPGADCPAFLLDCEDRDPDDSDYGFEWSFHGEAEERHLWVHADDHGDVDRLAHLVQKFLKTFRPDQCWSLSYANTCSKPRPDGFGGGALFVTADEIRSYSSGEFIYQQRQVFEAADQAGPAEMTIQSHAEEPHGQNHTYLGS